VTEKDKEAPYGRYASGRPRPKPVKKKQGKGWGTVKYWLMMKWWSKAIERWRKGKVLVEASPSRRAALRHHRVGVEGHAKSSLAQRRKAPARFFTHQYSWHPGKGWVLEERNPPGVSLAERRANG